MAKTKSSLTKFGPSTDYKTANDKVQTPFVPSDTIRS